MKTDSEIIVGIKVIQQGVREEINNIKKYAFTLKNAFATSLITPEQLQALKKAEHVLKQQAQFVRLSGEEKINQLKRELLERGKIDKLISKQEIARVAPIEGVKSIGGAMTKSFSTRIDLQKHFKKAVDRANVSLREQLSLSSSRGLTKSASSITEAIKRSSTKQVVVSQVTMQKKFKKSLDQANTSLNKQIDSLDTYANRVNKAQKRIPFAGFALSIMFFGMAIQRVFNGIAKSTTSVFQDVAHSSEGTVTALDTLAGGFKYLQFAVGDAISTALEPFVPVLMDIMMWLAEFVTNNPNVVAAFIAIGAVIGGLMTAGGMIWLGINGFQQLNSVMGMSIKKVNLLKGTVATIAFGLAITSAADAMSEFNKGNKLAGIVSAISSGFLAVGGGLLFKNTKLGAAAIAIGLSLMVIEKGIFFESIASIGIALLSFFGALGKEIGESMFSGINEAIGFGLEGLGKTLNMFYEGSGDRLEDLGRSFFNDAVAGQNFMKTFEENFDEAWDQWEGTTGTINLGERIDALVDKKLHPEDYPDILPAGIYQTPTPPEITKPKEERFQTPEGFGIPGSLMTPIVMNDVTIQSNNAEEFIRSAKQYQTDLYQSQG